VKTPTLCKKWVGENTNPMQKQWVGENTNPMQNTNSMQNIAKSFASKAVKNNRKQRKVMKNKK